MSNSKINRIERGALFFWTRFNSGERYCGSRDISRYSTISVEAAFIFARVRSVSRIIADYRGSRKTAKLNFILFLLRIRLALEKEREREFVCRLFRLLKYSLLSVILCFVHYAQRQNFASFYTESNFFISSLLFHLSILFFNGDRFRDSWPGMFLHGVFLPGQAQRFTG